MKKGKIKKTVTYFTLPLFVFVMLWLPLPSLPAAAEEPAGVGTLKGFIYKKDGKTPLWGAQVVLKNIETGEIIRSNVTDAIGDYEIKDKPAGNYKVLIIVKKKNHEIKKIDFLIKIVAGEITNISFAVKRKRFLFIFPFRLCEVVAIVAGVLAIVVAVKK